MQEIAQQIYKEELNASFYERRQSHYIEQLHKFNAEDYDSINEAMDAVENIVRSIRYNTDMLEITTDTITQLESELYNATH